MYESLAHAKLDALPAMNPNASATVCASLRRSGSMGVSSKLATTSASPGSVAVIATPLIRHDIKGGRSARVTNNDRHSYSFIMNIAFFLQPKNGGPGFSHVDHPVSRFLFLPSVDFAERAIEREREWITKDSVCAFHGRCVSQDRGCASLNVISSVQFSSVQLT